MNDFPDIHAAAKAGDADAVDRLLKADRQLVRAKDRYQNSPMHHAATAEVAQLLIDLRANVNADGWMGATPLHDAAQHGRADVVALLIRKGADVYARRTERRDTPLHSAATEAVARLLVEHGADVEARDWSGRTPLHWAAQFGHAEVARFLIGVGAAVDARAEPTPPKRPRRPRAPFAERLLLAVVGAVEAVFEPERAKAVARPDPHRFTGDTPLHWAAQEGKVDAAAVLLEHGADVNARDRDGSTPLHKAAFRGHGDLIGLLVRAGADPSTRDRSGRTPLHAAQREETGDLLRGLAVPPQSAEVPLSSTPAELGLAISQVCLHPNGREAIIAARNAVLTRWGLNDPPRMLAGLQTPHPWVSGVAALPDGEQFLTVSPAGVEARRWDDLRTIGALNPASEGWDSPTAVAASPDRRWVAVRHRPEELVVVDRATGRVADRVEAGERTHCVRFSPDSRLLATACSFQGGGHVRLDAVGEDGRLTPLAELGRSDLATPAGLFVDTLARVAFDPAGGRLALFETSAVGHQARPAGWRGNAVLYDLPTGRESWSASIDAALTGDDRSLADAGHPMGFVTDVVFAGGGLVACGATRGCVVFLSASDGSLAARTPVHDDAAVTALAYDPATNLVWAGLEDGSFVSVPVPKGVEA